MRPKTLRDAVRTGDLPGFEALIAKGARLGGDVEDPPLLELAASGGHGRIARRLIELGADVARAPRALAHAARHGDALLVAQLLERGAPVDVPDADGTSEPFDGRPLARAAQCGSLECVELLLPRAEHGLDEALAGAAIAVAPGHGLAPESVVGDELRERVLAIVERLLAKGASADGLARAVVGYTDEPWLIERAIDAGASPALADGTGSTLLHRAASRHAHRVVEALLAKGADPAAKDAGGATALDRATAEAAAEDETAKRRTLTALRRASGARPQRSRTREVPPARGTLRAGARVTHPDHGEGTVLAVKDGTARVRFSATETREISVDEIADVR